MPKVTKKEQLLVVLACVVEQGTQQSKHVHDEQHVGIPKFLLTRRSEPNQRELHMKWELPGGKVEFDEKPEEALIREIKEETGYSIEISRMIPFTYTTMWDYVGLKRQTVLLCYECKLLHRDQGTLNDKKIGGIEWFSFSEIDFSRVLHGSSEFIWHVAKEHGVKLKGFDSKATFAYFTCIEPSQNKNRFYSITYQVDPAAEYPYSVTTSRGRLTWKGSRKPILYRFSTYEEASKEILKRVRDRKYHGYSANSWSDNFPHQDFLNTFPKPKHSPQQLELWSFDPSL